MNKLMSSLVAATIVGAFSLSAIAADAPKSAPAAAITATAEKLATAIEKKHTKADAKKAEASAAAAAPAAPATPSKK